MKTLVVSHQLRLASTCFNSRVLMLFCQENPFESATGLRWKHCTCAPQSSQSFSSSCPVEMSRLRSQGWNLQKQLALKILFVKKHPKSWNTFAENEIHPYPSLSNHIHSVFDIQIHQSSPNISPPSQLVRSLQRPPRNPPHRKWSKCCVGENGNIETCKSSFASKNVQNLQHHSAKNHFLWTWFMIVFEGAKIP